MTLGRRYVTLEGETVYNGATIVCPDCSRKVPGPHVMLSASGYYIGYGPCECGPAYSRESPYFRTYEEASGVLEAHPSEYTRLVDG